MALNILPFLSCLYPEVAYNLTVPSLTSIETRFPYLSYEISAQELDLEWRQQAMNPKLGANTIFMDYWCVIFYKEKCDSISYMIGVKKVH